jgi:hypothetical protein
MAGMPGGDLLPDFIGTKPKILKIATFLGAISRN